LKAGYSATPLWKKLGYRDGVAAYVEDAPENYLAMLDLPEKFTVRWEKRARGGIKLVHVFAKSQSTLKAKLKLFRDMIDRDGIIWVSWLKKSSGAVSNLTEDAVREVALPLGLVDIKVCAVDQVWSGLKLVIRKELR